MFQSARNDAASRGSARRRPDRHLMANGLLKMRSSLSANRGWPMTATQQKIAARDSSSAVRTFTTKNFRLESGVVMPEVTIAYRTPGTLSANRDNVVLVTHGNTSGPQMIDPNGSAAEGSWQEIVGPGKPVDTNRYFALCPKLVGSAYGWTNGGSIDPASGKRYGSRFPDITVGDIVATQHALLADLGITRLLAIVGPSFGGFKVLQWAVDYPGML